MAALEQSLEMMFKRSEKTQEKTGNILEFEEVYRDYFRPMYAFVAYRVGDRTAAEDITSRVFEKALSAFSRYDPDRATLSTWLFTIARNSITDYFRDRKNRVFSELTTDNSTALRGNPEKELHTLETRRELARAMSGLNAREHEVLALKFGSGFTNREISKLLGITETNAGTILYRSLRKLKNQLEGGIENDG